MVSIIRLYIASKILSLREKRYSIIGVRKARG